MNFSRLIKAAAVVGLLGFGSHAVGAFTPIEERFETYDVGTFTNQLAGTGWTYAEGDVSEITTQLVATVTNDIPVVLPEPIGYGVSNVTQVLKLNTEGNDLKIAAGTTTNATVYVNTLIQMVGSESEQAIATNDFVQTAMYLDTSDTNNPVLKAFITGAGNTNEWASLYGAGVDVQDGDWIWLKVSIDYTVDAANQKPMTTFTVNDTVMTNAAGDAAFGTANRSESFDKRQVQEVAFRGTGMVDNFAITEAAPLIEKVTIVTRYVDVAGEVIESNLTQQAEFTIGQVTYHKTFDAAIDGYPQYELKEVRLTDGSLPAITNFAGDTAVFDVEDPPFSDGNTYYVEGVYEVKTYTVTLNFASEGAYTPTQEQYSVEYDGSFVFNLTGRVEEVNMAGVTVSNITDSTGPVAYSSPLLTNVTKDYELLLSAADWIDPAPPADDVEFTVVGENNANLVFTSMTLAGDTLTVAFTVDGTLHQTPATLWLLYTDALSGGTDGNVAIEAAIVVNGAELDGTFDIDLGALALPDSVFITGLSTTDPTP